MGYLGSERVKEITKEGLKVKHQIQVSTNRYRQRPPVDVRLASTVVPDRGPSPLLPEHIREVLSILVSNE